MVSDENFRFLMTAVRYNQVHAAVIITLGFVMLQKGKLGTAPTLRWSGILFVIGTMLFSFSIYLSVSFDIPKLLYATPIGGVTIMLSWLLLVLTGIVLRNKNHRSGDKSSH
ncbi:MAG: DUF423 domain-containing protein [Thiotrichales bacterium]|nr:DUF423 domain-containing protein [Thiotrichales bacterium]OUX53041.1 MAG: hypothetical protein CBE42_02335 [Methylococcaceae bacterium TMED282]